jgi:hypothetical protein
MKVRRVRVLKRTSASAQEQLRHRAFAGVAALVMLGSAFAIVAMLARADVVNVDYYVSNDATVSCSDDRVIGAGNYLVPDAAASWSDAVLYHQDGTPWGDAPELWTNSLQTSTLKGELLGTTSGWGPEAQWIWKVQTVTGGEMYTGDIVFFKETVSIPSKAIVTAVDLLIAADNAYYVYVNSDWTGTPLAIGNFATSYGPTNFYYISDTPNEMNGGGTASAVYETKGVTYPLEPSVGNEMVWSNIQSIGLNPALFETGDNSLQIVGVNEHAPWNGCNPAGVIYKLIVSYKTPIPVGIDVKPGSYPNSICLNDQGLLPVAILGSADFHVSDINPATVQIDGVFVAVTGSVKKPHLMWSLEDVNQDGYMDMVVHFDVQSLEPGVLNAGTVALHIDGYLYNGDRFTGSDSVNIVPPAA